MAVQVYHAVGVKNVICFTLIGGGGMFIRTQIMYLSTRN